MRLNKPPTTGEENSTLKIEKEVIVVTESYVEKVSRDLKTKNHVVLYCPQWLQSHIEWMFQLAAELFSLDDAIKLKYEDKESGHQTGYTPRGVEHAKDAATNPGEDTILEDDKEFWQVMEHGAQRNRGGAANIIPTEVQSFDACSDALMSGLMELGMEFLTAVEVAWGLPDGAITSNIIGGNSVMRIIHSDERECEHDQPIVSPHKDASTGTILISYGGTYVQDANGEYHEAKAERCQLTAFIGDAGESFVDYHFGKSLLAATHKVLMKKGSHPDRYSIALFMHFRPDVPIGDGRVAQDDLDQRKREIGVM